MASVLGLPAFADEVKEPQCSLSLEVTLNLR